MDWRAHSAAEHGVRPQESLNAQLVEDADIVIALFWHRLGSPTGEAESGTLEEIDRAQARGAYVAILRCMRSIPRDVDPAQLQKLNDFFAEVESRSLMLSYDEDVELGRHVDAILNRADTRSETRAEVTAQTTIAGAEVWPRVERSEHPETNSQGRLKTKSRWRLVLSNTGQQAARNVQYRLEPEQPDDSLPQILESGGSRIVEALAPGGERRTRWSYIAAWRTKCAASSLGKTTQASTRTQPPCESSRAMPRRCAERPDVPKSAEPAPRGPRAG